jgi:heme/copper-type cytochrome/quinol oxidase subunit 1
VSGDSDVAGDNPWDAHTLEWGTSSPVPADNYAVAPTVMSPEPVLDLRAAPDFATAAQVSGGAQQSRSAS